MDIRLWSGTIRRRKTSVINLNHHSFNIFINGGSGETEGRKWLDDDIQPGEPSSSNQEKILKWESFIAREMCNLSRIDDARTNKKYIAFKKGIFEQKPPQELLGLNKGFTVRELKTSYRTLAPIFIPIKMACQENQQASL